MYNFFRSWGRPCATLIFFQCLYALSECLKSFSALWNGCGRRSSTLKHIFFWDNPNKSDPITWHIQHKDPTGPAVCTLPPLPLACAYALSSRGLGPLTLFGTLLGVGRQVVYPPLWICTPALGTGWMCKKRTINVIIKYRFPVLLSYGLSKFEVYFSRKKIHV